MNKVLQSILLVATLALTNVAHSENNNAGSQNDSGPNAERGFALSSDLPGLLALGAVALVAGAQVARRNKRK